MREPEDPLKAEIFQKSRKKSSRKSERAEQSWSQRKQQSPKRHHERDRHTVPLLDRLLEKKAKGGDGSLMEVFDEEFLNSIEEPEYLRNF